MTATSAWIEDFLLELLQTPTQVPTGLTEVAPGDPRIVHAVDRVLLPRVEELAPDEIRRHPKGDLAARFGPEGPGGVILQTYIVSQHANLMDEPEASRIVDGDSFGVDGSVAIGQGATQNKGPAVAAFAALRNRPRGATSPVWLVVNTEGSSSHGGSSRVIDGLGVTGACGIIAFGTDLKVSLGNRGRADVHIRVRGKSSHSSQPQLGRNPIEDAADVIAHLRTIELPAPHPILGPASATPYQFACHPVAPHTIPEEVRIVVDRRVLPGETPEQAVAGVASHFSGHPADLEIEAGVSMLPAQVDIDAPVVQSLLAGLRAEGHQAETFWSPNAFDAGYGCSVGIPSVMFGPGKRSFVGEGLIGTDLIPVADVDAAARALHRALHTLSGAS